MSTFASMFISVVFVGMVSTAAARSVRPDDRYTRIFPDNIEEAQRNFRNAKALMHPQLYNPEEESMMPGFEHRESGDAENELDSDLSHGEEGHMHDEEEGHSHEEEGHSHGDEGHSHGEEGHSHGEEGHSHDEDGHSLHGDAEMDSSNEGEGDDESDMGQGLEGSSDVGFQLPGVGFLLGNPLLSLKFINEYFVKLERALDRVFRESLAEAMNDMNAFTNTTDEVVDIDGQKYKVRKTLVKKGNENSSVLIETMASELLSNETEVPKNS